MSLLTFQFTTVSKISVAKSRWGQWTSLPSSLEEHYVPGVSGLRLCADNLMREMGMFCPADYRSRSTLLSWAFLNTGTSYCLYRVFFITITVLPCASCIKGLRSSLAILWNTLHTIGQCGVSRPQYLVEPSLPDAFMGSRRVLCTWWIHLPKLLSQLEQEIVHFTLFLHFSPTGLKVVIYY